MLNNVQFQRSIGNESAPVSDLKISKTQIRIISKMNEIAISFPIEHYPLNIENLPYAIATRDIPFQDSVLRSPSSKLSGSYPSSRLALSMLSPVFSGRLAGCFKSAEVMRLSSETSFPRNPATLSAMS